MSSEPTPPNKAVRRRASRAAGPAGGGASHEGAPAATAVRLKEAKPSARPARQTKPAGPPPRRRPNRRAVAVIALVFGLVAAVATGGAVALMYVQQQRAQAEQARDQRFVDTATHTVVNMFSFTQDSIEDSVNSFVSSTSGPLRDMMSNNNNVENLKALFRETSSSSEAVVNGAALEGFDSVSDNASVLVSVRVTVSDQDGNNKPSQPYRMRVVVHEDENGQMTTYDLKYPDGGN